MSRPRNSSTSVPSVPDDSNAGSPEPSVSLGGIHFHPFRGDKGEPARVWLDRFDRFAEANPKYPVPRLLALFASLLEGAKANNWLRSLGPLNLLSWDEVRDSFSQNFFRALHSDPSAALLRRVQLADEDVLDFGNALMSIALDLRRRKIPIEDRFLISHYTHGLLQDSIRQQLLRQSNQLETFAAAMTLAHAEEAALQVADRNPTASAILAVDPQIAVIDAINSLRAEISDRLAAAETSIAILTRRMDSLPRRSDSPAQTLRSRPECTYCHRIGHTEAKCISRLEEEVRSLRGHPK